VRGGRSLDALDAFAARWRAAGRGGVAFVAVCVDDGPSRAARSARAKWPNLAHLWIDSPAVAAARVAFVPNRAVATAERDIIKWWDGSHGNVLRGPHGASRKNGSQSLSKAIADGLDR